MLKPLLTVTLLASASTLAFAEAQVKPIALAIGSPALDSMDFGLKPGGISAGTTVHVLITGLETPIVDVDEDASSLDKAIDSTGKDLLTEPARQEGSMMMARSGIGSFPSVSEDGKAAVVELAAPQPPAAGATSVTLEGRLSIVVAAGTTTLHANEVELTAGQVNVEGLDLEITEIAPSDWEEGKFKLALRMDAATHEKIASWRILDPEGQTIGEDPYSTMSMMGSVEVELTLASQPQTIQIELQTYEGMQRIELPLKLEVGLGVE